MRDLDTIRRQNRKRGVGDKLGRFNGDPRQINFEHWQTMLDIAAHLVESVPPGRNVFEREEG